MSLAVKKMTNGAPPHLTDLLHKNDCGGEITYSLQRDGVIFSSSFCSQFRYGPYIMLLSGPAWQWSRVIFSSLVHKVNSISFPPLCSVSTSLLIYSAGCTPIETDHLIQRLFPGDITKTNKQLSAGSQTTVWRQLIVRVITSATWRTLKRLPL